MDREYQIILTNNSSHFLRTYVALGYRSSPIYPDTTLPKIDPLNFEEIPPNRPRFTISGSGVKWKEIYKTLPADTFSIFVFDSDTLKKYGWEGVRSEYKALKRYDLSLADLERINYEIVYPPNASMEGIKMYPN